MSEDGRRLGSARITNGPAALGQEFARAGDHPRAVLEATYGWHWAADVLEASGAEVHLARATAGSRTTSGTPRIWRTCCGWGGCPKRGSPPEVRELREITRVRRKLVDLRTSCKDQVHGVLAKLGITVTCTDIFGKAGAAWLDQLALPQPYAGKVCSLRQLADELDTEITMLTR